MADYYWLTITYPDGRVVRTPHKGESISTRFCLRMKALGARLELGGLVGGPMAAQLAAIAKSEADRHTLRWRSQLPDAGGEDG